MKNDICLTYRINDEEYAELDEKFTKLVYFAAHALKRKNTRNNHTDEIEDISQDLQLSVLRAGSYYKRQIYIEKCLALAKKYSEGDTLIHNIVLELENLWQNRTRHGANRQKYGPHQEKLLDKIVRRVVPEEERPRKKAKLKFDSKFSTYCKAIVWNTQKSMGKKITREKSIRSGLVSLSEFDLWGEM